MQERGRLGVKMVQTAMGNKVVREIYGGAKSITAALVTILIRE